MNNDLSTRVQNILSKVEQLKVKKIEDETNAKRYKEDMDEILAKLKELGYNSIDEAKEAIKNLEETLTKECEDIEKQLEQVEV